jgi:hypothetical protein
MNYQGPMPTKDTIRKILVMKIKNSSVYFNFPMEIQVFESSNNSSMSWFAYEILWFVFKIYVFILINNFYFIFHTWKKKIYMSLLI